MTLGEIVGKPLTGEWGNDDETGTGVPVLRTTNFTNDGIIDYTNVITRIITAERAKEKYLKCGDIIIEKSGGSEKQPVGRVVYYDGPDEKYLFNNFTSVLRIKNIDVWNAKYIFYALFANYQNGGTQKYQNKTTGLHNLQLGQYINDFSINQLPMDTQKKVADILDKIISLIALCKRQLNKLDELVKSRFIEMFGDPIIDNGRYTRDRLGNLTTVGSSKRIFEKEYVSKGIPFYRTKEIVELSQDKTISTELFITQERYNEVREKYGVPQKGDLLISAVGTIGAIWIVDGKNSFYYKDGNLLQVSSTKKYKPAYLKYLLEVLINEYKQQMSSGTAYAALTITALKDMLIYEVPIEEQQAFVLYIEKSDKLKYAIKQRLEKLETLKNSLMQRYFG